MVEAYDPDEQKNRLFTANAPRLRDTPSLLAELRALREQGAKPNVLMSTQANALGSLSDRSLGTPVAGPYDRLKMPMAQGQNGSAGYNWQGAMGEVPQAPGLSPQQKALLGFLAKKKPEGSGIQPVHFNDAESEILGGPDAMPFASSTGDTMLGWLPEEDKRRLGLLGGSGNANPETGFQGFDTGDESTGASDWGSDYGTGEGAGAGAGAGGSGGSGGAGGSGGGMAAADAQDRAEDIAAFGPSGSWGTGGTGWSGEGGAAWGSLSGPSYADLMEANMYGAGPTTGQSKSDEMASYRGDAGFTSSGRSAGTAEDPIDVAERTPLIDVYMDPEAQDLVDQDRDAKAKAAAYAAKYDPNFFSKILGGLVSNKTLAALGLMGPPAWAFGLGVGGLNKLGIGPNNAMQSAFNALGLNPAATPAVDAKTHMANEPGVVSKSSTPSFAEDGESIKQLAAQLGVSPAQAQQMMTSLQMQSFSMPGALPAGNSLTGGLPSFYWG